MIYLDHNATTPLAPEVLSAMLPFLTDHFGSPSSAHAFGKAPREAIHAARVSLASLIDCEPDELVFTGGSTESNNLAIFGLPAKGALFTSVIEHPATTESCAHWAKEGRSIVKGPVGPDGRASLTPLEDALSGGGVDLVSLIHAHNETGVLQPIGEAAKLAHAHGARLHVDGAQSVGKIPISVRALGVDLMSIAAHKFYGPKGVGALYIRRGTPIHNTVFGGGHERGLRPGTENVAGIVGLGAAAALAARFLKAGEPSRQAALRDELIARLRLEIPDLSVFGEGAPRLPNTAFVGFPGAFGSAVLRQVRRVSASTGSACHEGHEAPPAVLIAMGIAPDVARSAVRISLGRSTSREMIETATSDLITAYRAARAG